MEVAERAANFIRRHLYNEQTRRLQHCFRNGPSKAPGFLDDYAFLISGLLDLYECGGNTDWLVWASELQDMQARAVDSLISTKVVFPSPSLFILLAYFLIMWCRMNYSSIEKVEPISTLQEKIHLFFSE